MSRVDSLGYNEPLLKGNTMPTIHEINAMSDADVRALSKKLEKELMKALAIKLVVSVALVIALKAVARRLNS